MWGMCPNFGERWLAPEGRSTNRLTRRRESGKRCQRSFSRPRTMPISNRVLKKSALQYRGLKPLKKAGDLRRG